MKDDAIFQTKKIDGKGIVDSNSAWDRVVDTEARILEQVASELENNTSSKGIIKLHTIFEPCESCKSVIKQFTDMYPHISIDISWD